MHCHGIGKLSIHTDFTRRQWGIRKSENAATITIVDANTDLFIDRHCSGSVR
jgi:hypothetical protein